MSNENTTKNHKDILLSVAEVPVNNVYKTDTYTRRSSIVQSESLMKLLETFVQNLTKTLL